MNRVSVGRILSLRILLAFLIASTTVGVGADEPRRARRVLYNFDGDSCLSTKAGVKGPAPVDAADVKRLIDEIAYEGSRVDTVLVCINAQVMYYPTKVGTMRGALASPEERAKWPASEQQRFANLKAFFDSGADPYAIMLAEAKRRGREALLSFRMNDDHGDDFLRTQFLIDHPDWRVGTQRYQGRDALDFGRDEVLDHTFRLIEEAVRRYDCDGIELDFNRFPIFFKGGSTDERVAKMNSLVERVRKLLDEVGGGRGRKLTLAVRVPSNYGRTPPTPETARQLGCDVPAWARQGWVDFVTVSEFLHERGDLPIGLWKLAITNVPVYGGIECTKGGGKRNLTADEYRHAAAELIKAGADGVYLFNFFTSREGGAAAYDPPFEALCDLAAKDGSGVSSKAAIGSEQLAKDVTIARDEWGVPHIEGKTDAAVAFGMGYAQGEDFFWQVEDTYIQGIGRYAEVIGDKGLKNDILNRQFEVARRSQADFETYDADLQAIAAGYAAGLNYFLKTHPNTKPRLIERFEPWHVLAYERQILLSFLYRQAHVERPDGNGFEESARRAVGSNEWALGPSKTKAGTTMLFLNPHQPWYGFGQYYESHVKSGEGLDFSGACFFGSPLPAMGFNADLGWTYAVNEPDVADGFRLTFDDPTNPLRYRYGKEYRTAVEWPETIKVRTPAGMQEKKYVFRKSHHGPIVRKENARHFVAVRIANLFGRRMRQGLGMLKARNFQEWKSAASLIALPMFNTAYADRHGNIFYVYNGAVPVRDPQFAWKGIVDGGDPRTDWKTVHAFDALPQVFNPSDGYVQNCNSTPYTTNDRANPSRDKFPAYMVEDADHDSRRAQVSRKLLREASGVTFERMQELAYDTTLFWPLTEIPKLKPELDKLRTSRPELAREIEPYFAHLQNWDCRAAIDSTQTTLCVMWYMALFGEGYPAETMKSEYAGKPVEQLRALAATANSLKGMYGDWKVRWGDVHRMQRVAPHGDVLSAAMAFANFGPSVPCAGTPGPLGIVFTVYSTPAVPVLRPKRFGVVGASYIGVVEFGEKVRAASVLNYGISGDPKSPHYFDQAALFSKQKLKPAWFYPEDVAAHTVRKYHPGEAVELSSTARRQQ